MLNGKQTSWKIILLYLLVNTVIVSWINLVLFPRQVFFPISKATGNLIDATMQANFLNIAVFWIFFFIWARLQPADVGLRWHKLPQGICLTAILWAGIQGIMLVIGWAKGDIQFDPDWSGHGVTTILGGLIGQLLGNAFFEEMQYRGLYLPQFFCKIKTHNEMGRLAWSVLLMLLIFILSHIPNRIFYDYSLADIPLDFALLFVWGLFFTAVYLLSGNLFLAVGVHALANTPTLVTESSIPPQALLFILTLILLAFLRTRSRKRGRTDPLTPFSREDKGTARLPSGKKANVAGS